MRAVMAGLLGLSLSIRVDAAILTIQVMDAAGEGFNDPTPFTPIGGNSAATLGQARLNVFTEAARLWGQLINSNVTIVIEARFDPLTCSANSGVLGSAGPTWIFHDFPGAPLPNVYYPAALADALHGSNLAGTNSSGVQYGFTDITATFNSSINGDVNCLGGSFFYLGLDHQLSGHNDGRTYVADLLGVVLHELGHGLGFVSLVDQTGAGVADSSGVVRLGVFEQFVYDEGAAQFWSQMSNAQRAQSATGQSAGGNAGLVWNGAQVNGHHQRLTAGLSSAGHVRLFAPAVYDASSSVSHWDMSATPDLLMEPRYTLDTGNHTDLTTCALYDLGWVGGFCPDELTAVAGQPLAITLQSENIDGSPVTFTITAPPAHGTVGAISGATLTYTPAAGFVGADQFSFQVSDAIVSPDLAVVSINVQAAASGGGSPGGAGGQAGSGGGGSLVWPEAIALGVAMCWVIWRRRRAPALRRRVGARLH